MVLEMRSLFPEDRDAAEIYRYKLNVHHQPVVGLTKINFNACVFADGLPVTLKFADAVGDILTAAPVGDLPPLPFRHYI